MTRSLSGASATAPGRALKSAWWTDPWADPRRKLSRFLDVLILPGAVQCPWCHLAADQRLCPGCHRELPVNGLGPRETGSITIFGPQAIGKTTYMTVLLQEIRKSEEPERRLGLKPLNDEIRTRYRHEYHDVIYGAGDLTVGELKSGSTRTRHAPTLSLEIDRRVLQPLVYELKIAGSTKASPVVSFVDLAGEDWEMKIDLLRREGGHLLRESRGLLFLIDPLRIPEVAGQIELTEEEANVPAADYLEDADKLADFFSRVPVRTPLAICLNKVDRWGPLLSPQSVLHQLARSIATKAADAPLDWQIHEEVRSALRLWGQMEFLDRLETDFPTHQFFACSALGDAATLHGEEPPPAPTPLLVERAALWLLERQKLL